MPSHFVRYSYYFFSFSFWLLKFLLLCVLTLYTITNYIGCFAFSTWFSMRWWIFLICVGIFILYYTIVYNILNRNYIHSIYRQKTTNKINKKTFFFIRRIQIFILCPHKFQHFCLICFYCVYKVLFCMLIFLLLWFI